jgi:hypothetical protein
MGGDPGPVEAKQYRLGFHPADDGAHDVRGAVVWVAEDLHAGNGGQGGTQ